MALHIDRPDFTVDVEGSFAARGRWVIHGVVRFRPDLGAVSRTQSEPEARFELFRGIVREDRRGRELGAQNVHVFVEGDIQAERSFDEWGGSAATRHA